MSAVSACPDRQDFFGDCRKRTCWPAAVQRMRRLRAMSRQTDSVTGSEHLQRFPLRLFGEQQCVEFMLRKVGIQPALHQGAQSFGFDSVEFHADRSKPPGAAIAGFRRTCRQAQGFDLLRRHGQHQQPSTLPRRLDMSAIRSACRGSHSDLLQPAGTLNRSS